MSIILLNWKLNFLLCCFGLFILNQPAKKGGTVLGEMTDPDHQGDNELLATMVVRKVMSGIQEILFGVPELSCPVIKGQ